MISKSILRIIQKCKQQIYTLGKKAYSNNPLKNNYSNEVKKILIKRAANQIKRSKTVKPSILVGNNADEFYRHGQQYEKNGDHDNAFIYYARANSLIYQHELTWNSLEKIGERYTANAEIAYKERRVADAIDLYVKAIECILDSSSQREKLSSLINKFFKHDLTKQCFVLYDPVRADSIHRETILRCLEYVTLGGVCGDIFEFGVLAGWSARIFAELMRDIHNLNSLWLFDSFQGLPEYSSSIDINSYEIAGRNIWKDKMRFSDDFISQLGSNIEEHIVSCLATIIYRERIYLRKGFFSDSLTQPIGSKAAIVHIDCDLYESTIEVLEGLYKQDVLQDGCVLIFDDWNCNKANPEYGERKAFSDFLSKQNKFYASEWFSYGFNGNVFLLHNK